MAKDTIMLDGDIFSGDNWKVDSDFVAEDDDSEGTEE